LTTPATRACEEKRDMTDTKRLPGFRAIAMAVAVACSGCAGDSPTQPSTPSAASEATVGAPRAQGAGNSPPTLVWKTTPRADLDAVPYPTITGSAPLAVRFNLCPSTDPEQVTLPDGTFDPSGDFINWQFHFGETGEAFSPDGSFNPDFDHFCRVEHVYESAGQYVATLRVTDRRVSDASQEIGSMAAASTRLTVNVLPESSSAPVVSFKVRDSSCTGEYAEVTLAWTTTNATGVTIAGVGSFGPDGQTTVTGLTGEEVTFTITAFGPGGTVTTSIRFNPCVG
jgi:hypothetical protein